MQYPDDYVSVTQGYSSKHKGLDLGWYSILHHHQPIYAVEDGEVIYTKDQGKNSGGLVVHIRHKIGGEYYVSEYGHLKEWCVVVGQKVSRGQQIGRMGATGKVTGEHLHTGLCKGMKITYTSADQWVNPMDYYEIYPNQVVNDRTKKEYGNKIKYYTGDLTPGVYQTLYNMNIRKSPNGARTKVKECTNAMKKALVSKAPNDYAVIKKGTNITILEVVDKSKTSWGRNYSGYVCLEDINTQYCKKVK